MFRHTWLLGLAVTASALLGTAGSAVAAEPSAARGAPTTAQVQGKDARAAAGLPSGASPRAAWYSGTVAAGATQYWVWNNALLTAVYEVGLSPTGASTSAPCQFEVTRSWDAQVYGGERKFHFLIQNVGTVACATNILLTSVTSGASWSTGGLNPGQSGSAVWNNANPLTASYLVGLSPTGSTTSAACQFEVIRSWYVRLSSGERKFWFTYKNVGTIACSADVRLASVSTTTSWSTGWLAAGASAGSVWYNANPLTLVYLPGLLPAVPTGSATCQLEVTRGFYSQQINTDGTVQRTFTVHYRNSGTAACSGTLLLASAAA